MTATRYSTTVLAAMTPVRPKKWFKSRMAGTNRKMFLSRVRARDGSALPLTERLRSYMTYQCENRSFKGLEKAAEILRCSPRQLQRVVNQLEEEGVLEKVGKGSYRLI